MDPNALREKLQGIANEVYLLKLKELLKDKNKEILVKKVFLNRKQAVEKILSVLEESAKKEEVSEVYFHYLDLEEKSKGHYEVILRISFVVPSFMRVKKKDSETKTIPINEIRTINITLLEFYTTEFFV